MQTGLESELTTEHVNKTSYSIGVVCFGRGCVGPWVDVLEKTGKKLNYLIKEDSYDYIFACKEGLPVERGSDLQRSMGNIECCSYGLVWTNGQWK